ncbi:hypothetical protein MFLAVUS_005374 [Mucor flavus]|uniref:Uncharacterized protein n=1 Tax=Mucor flavus TaxID=439312 RepID=A0ABP9YYJ2_9FUNG
MQTDYFNFQNQEEEDIDERINVLDFEHTHQQPLQSPDLVRRYFITQLLLSRVSPGSHKSFFEEDWMFKEQVIASQQNDSV